MEFWPSGALALGWIVLYGISIAVSVGQFCEKNPKRVFAVAWKCLPFMVALVPAILTVDGVRDMAEMVQAAVFMLLITGVLVYITLRQWRRPGQRER